MLNRVLTVKPGTPGSHRGKGWETVTEQAIQALVARRPAAGRPALGPRRAEHPADLLGDTPRVESVHPSPMSADRGFFGSRPFSRVNQLLTDQGARAGGLGAALTRRRHASASRAASRSSRWSRSSATACRSSPYDAERASSVSSIRIAPPGSSEATSTSSIRSAPWRVQRGHDLGQPQADPGDGPLVRRRRPDQVVAEPSITRDEPSDDVAIRSQRALTATSTRGADQAAEQAVVRADDGVLHDVGQQQHDDQVEGVELAQHPLAGEAQQDDQPAVDDDRPQHLLA